MLAAASRVLVIEKGGTPSWVPLVATLLTVLVAGVASYFATWWFKKRDIDGVNAHQAATLVDDSETALPGPTTYEPEDQSDSIQAAARLLREARLRAQPLHDHDLDERLQTALLFLSDVQEWTKQPVGVGPWMRAAMENVRAGLAPYLAPPPALPWRRLREDAERSFPAFSEYIGIKRDGGDPEEITQMLDDWYAEEAAQLSEEAQQGA
jgi:hypothetical protein